MCDGGGVERGNEGGPARSCCALLADKIHAPVNLSRYRQKYSSGGGGGLSERGGLVSPRRLLPQEQEQ